MSVHKSNIHGDKRKIYPCDMCNKTFARRNHLSQHKSSIHEGKNVTKKGCKSKTESNLSNEVINKGT